MKIDYRKIIKYIGFCAFLSSIFSISTFAQVDALRITADNAEQLIRQGPDAIGGIGDWWISNGTLCAVISDEEHEGEFSTKGGALIDLGFCDRSDDFMTRIQGFLDGDRASAVNVNQISMQSDALTASVITRADKNGVQVITRYSLDVKQPSVLSISMQLRIIDEELDGFNLYTDTWFNLHSLETFLFSSTEPSHSRGFEHIDFVTRGVSAIREAHSIADTIIFLSPPSSEYPIAYGWQLKSAKRVTSEESYPIPAFILSDEESTAILILSDDFYLGSGDQIGYLQIPQIPLLSLDKDEWLEIETVIHVGAKSDVAVITDKLLNKSVTVSGTTLELDSVLHVHDQQGNPVTFVRPDALGAFEFQLAQNSYVIEHRGVAQRSVKHELVVQQSDIELGELILPPAGNVVLPQGYAMRLVFKGVNGTDDPNFVDSLTGYKVKEGDDTFYYSKVPQLFLGGIDSDPKTVVLPAGNYRVYATRGPEYSVTKTELLVLAGKVTRLNLDLPERVIETQGYIAADLHVHSAAGFDNAFGMKERVKTFVAEQGEVLVSSEHDVPIDLAPVIKFMGLDDQLISIAAVEMTSLLISEKNPYTGGHINFFPVQPKPNEYRKGMINHENRRLREILHDFDHSHPGVVSQLNHARNSLALSNELPNNYQELIDQEAYLEHMGEARHPYDPQQSLDTHPNNKLVEPDPLTGVRDIDFDAMEIINPGGIFHHDRIDAVRRDWLSFLAQGFHITGTANSDSHNAGQQVAVPRTMVAVNDDSIAGFDQAEFLAAIKQGNAYGSTGPMLEVSLSNQTSTASMGETLSGSKASLNLVIKSADWVSVDSVKVSVNTDVVIESSLDGKRQLSFELSFDKDSFVTVEVSGPASDDYKVLYPEITPYAFTNPIYVDFDEDGQWHAPGL